MLYKSINMVQKPNIVKATTKKQKKIITLPAIKSYIYQPNRVTNAVYDYSLMQERLFTAVIYYLQGAIKLSLDGKNYAQLALFKEYEQSQFIKIHIPLREITIPQHYEQVKKSLKQLASIVIEIPYNDAVTNEGRILYKGLLSADIPEVSNRSSTIEIEIDKRVAKLLIEIEQNKVGQPINYTRYVYEIAQNATNKYTSRIYKLICSWRKKGGFTISLDEFRQWIGIESKYKFYADIKKNILIPVQEELYEKADCWFNCLTDDFVTKQGNSVTHINFKVISPELIQEEGQKRDYIFHLLRTHFKFQDKHIDKVKGIIDGSKASDVLYKITQLREHCVTNSSKIEDVPGYVIKSLQNQFLDVSAKLF